MDLEKYSIFLEQTRMVIEALERLDQKDGEMFNLFEILGRGTDEVLGHSAFIANLLDPAGSHGQGELFLGLFLEQLGLGDYEHGARHYFVTTEHSFGSDSDPSGRIDILLTSPGKYIIIENKIHADDQDRQLERYHSYANRAAEEAQDIFLFYLTLDGSSPSPSSLGSLDEEAVINISYEVEIDEWIGSCIKEVAGLPIIRESLVQYQNLIRYLTGKTRSRSVESRLVEMLKKPETLKVAIDIEKVLPGLKSQIQRAFWETLEKSLMERLSLNQEQNLSDYDEYVDLFYIHGKGKTNYGIRIVIGKYDGVDIGFKIEIAQEYHFGFIAFDNGVRISNFFDQSSRFGSLINIIKEIDPNYRNNNHWLGWKYPDDELRLNFREFDRKCAELADKAYLDSFVCKLVNILEGHIKSLISKLEKVEIGVNR